MGRYKRWTQEEDNKLIELYKAGQSYIQIGERLNRTNSSVDSRITRLGKRGLLKPHKTLKTPKYYYEYNFGNLKSVNPLSTYFVISILCDGHIRQRNIHFSFKNRDIFKFRKIFGHILKMNHLPRIIPMEKYNWSKFYLHSKALSDLLHEKYNLPIGEKSGKIKIPNEILECDDPRINGAVLRSAYECEGCADIKSHSPNIVIGNTSKAFLRDLSVTCNKHNIETRIYKISLVIRDLESIIKYYEMAYSLFDFPYVVKAKKREFNELIKRKKNLGCKYTNLFNEIEFKKVLKELIRLKYISGYNNKELNEWLKKNHNLSIGLGTLANWTNNNKIMNVFGKSREEIIEELKIEAL